MIIYLLINSDKEKALKLKENISISDIKYDINQEILKTIYDYMDSGKDILNVLDSFQEQEIINQITKIMADDYEITDIDKCIEDVINSYNKERLITKRNEILLKLDDKNNTKEEMVSLEKELSQIIIKLAKMK